MTQLQHPFVHFVLIMALAGALAGCGRRGPLEPPPGSAAPTAAPQGQILPGPAQPVEEPKKANDSFILDPLLD